MSPRRRWRALLAAAAAAMVITATPGPDADAQDDPPVDSRDEVRIDIVEQTRRVGADPTFVEVDIADAPTEARLGICVVPPVTDRDALRDAHDEPPRNCTISNFDEPLEALAVEGRPGRYRITVPDAPPDGVGELLRLREGALPVVVSLRHQEEVLDEVVTQFLVIGDEPTAPPTVDLGIVADLRAPIAHLPDQTVADPSAAMTDALARLEPLGEAPAGLAVGPETLSALAVTAPDSLEPIRAAAEGRDLLSEPWVAVDEEAWRAVGETDTVLDQYSQGREAVELHLGVSPGGVVRVDADADAATIALLRAAGATAVLLDPDRTTIDLEVADARPVRVRDDNDVAMTALLFDERLAATLDHPDPELAAGRAVAELVLTTLEGPGDRVALLDLPALAPDTIPVLLDLVEQEPRVALSPLPTLLDAPPARTSTGAVVDVRLRPRPAPDVTGIARARARASARVDSLATMVTSTDAPIVPLRTQLMVAPAAELDEPAALAYVDSVLASVGDQIDGVTIVDAERITLATRTADLPVTIRNDQTVTLTVEVTLRSEKLRFPDGDRLRIDLAPGANALTVPVETQSSGDARVTVAISSPDGRLALDEAVVPVRSTALSGIGLLISAVALSVLLVWWIRTVRRTRRARSAATVLATDADEAEPDQGGPVDPDRLDVVSGEEP